MILSGTLNATKMEKKKKKKKKKEDLQLFFLDLVPLTSLINEVPILSFTVQAHRTVHDEQIFNYHTIVENIMHEDGEERGERDKRRGCVFAGTTFSIPYLHSDDGVLKLLRTPVELTSFKATSALRLAAQKFKFSRFDSFCEKSPLN
ncbi:hypothetical protein D8674_024442 [Pyrus ussuriensis x Pyrus communis]|uniref:Uncharacterized protein n=1 Tax=Pyrus ussuriensis x Pyrus communis TaxID=2448454 RepID=A0A5N5HA10_9ROSA|nr:hypothetical protein D8674_024442 [Pyrus ussuriensis x Pyrus communis]